MNRKSELILKAVRRGKYSLLFEFLAERSGNQIEITFSELEQILGFKLPDSAYLYRPWWANQAKSGHSQAMAWDTAGGKTKLVNLEEEKLMFERVVVRDETETMTNTDNIEYVSNGSEYWVYENWTHKKAIVHSGECSHCNHGNGMHLGSSKDNGQWIGPFTTLEQASNIAQATGRDEIRRCQRCR